MSDLRRRLRRAGMFAIALLLVAALWELHEPIEVTLQEGGA
jgi:hypothetical protein